MRYAKSFRSSPNLLVMDGWSRAKSRPGHKKGGARASLRRSCATRRFSILAFVIQHTRMAIVIWAE